MRKTIALSMLIGLGASACTSKEHNIRIHTIGDSTMEKQDANVKEQRGWPQFLQQFFSEDVVVINHGKSGTSSKSFYKEGFWDRARTQIRKDDYVFIQFAHNDEKDNGLDSKVGTAPTDSFRIYLKRYIDEVLQLGGKPILVTPVVRNMLTAESKVNRRGLHDLGEHFAKYVDNSFNPADTVTYNYSLNMRSVAAETGCELIDMTASTARFVNSLNPGESKSLVFNLPKDGTHYGPSGALLFSRLASEEMAEKNILGSYIRKPSFIINPMEVNLGECFPGMTLTAVVDVCCLGADDEHGELLIEASEGIMILADGEEKSVANTKLPYSIRRGISTDMIKVSLTPDSAGEYTGHIIISRDGSGSQKKVVVRGVCRELSQSQPFKVAYTLHNHNKSKSEGAIESLEMSWNGMKQEGFGWPATENSDEPRKAKVQFNTTSDGTWPGGEIDIVHSRYVQFGVHSIEGTALNVDSIGIDVGGGVSFRLACSTDKDFIESATIIDAPTAGKWMKSFAAPVNKQLKSGENLYFKIYPWCEDKNNESTLSIRNIRITGIQTAE